LDPIDIWVNTRRIPRLPVFGAISYRPTARGCGATLVPLRLREVPVASIQRLPRAPPDPRLPHLWNCEELGGFEGADERIPSIRQVGKSRGASEFVHVAIDDVSRVAYSQSISSPAAPA
jgi:hypothetical protein